MSVSLTPAARALALHLGIVDLPGPRKIHLAPVPLLGGLAIYFGAVLAILAFADLVDIEARRQTLGILAGASVLIVVGSLDDHRLLHPQVKLFVAMPMAAVILLAVGIRATAFSSLFGAHAPWLLTDYALTILWVVGITAAFNILDHMDGLAAGVAAIASAFFLLFAVLGSQLLVGTLAAAMLGASLGFLRWNFAPARIFMGDGGAMFLGFMLATVGLKLRFPDLSAVSGALVPCFVLGMPIFDTTLVTVSRSRRGLLPFASPGEDHTSHRLSKILGGHERAVVALYAAGTSFGGLAVLTSRAPEFAAQGLALTVAAVALLLIALLERCPFERQETS